MNVRNLPKQIILWIACFLWRLVPFRPANAEPLMGTLMPAATRFGVLANLVWLVSGIVVYDYFTEGIGSYTWEVAFTYALISIAASWYFKKVSPTRRHYIGFSVVATLVFDCITGPILIGIAHPSQINLIITGQIPFTLAHLAGNVLIAAFLSPIIQRWVIENQALEFTLGTKQVLVTK